MIMWHPTSHLGVPHSGLKPLKLRCFLESTADIDEAFSSAAPLAHRRVDRDPAFRHDFRGFTPAQTLKARDGSGASEHPRAAVP